MKLLYGKDYYDNANAGIDTSIIFVRNDTEEVFYKDKNPAVDPDFPFKPRNITRRSGFFRTVDDRKCTIELSYVLFAGEVFPAMRFCQNSETAFGGIQSHYLHTDGSHVVRGAKTLGFRGVDIEFIYSKDRCEEVLSQITDDLHQHFLGGPSVHQKVFSHFSTRNPRWSQWLIDREIVTGYVQAPYFRSFGGADSRKELGSLRANGDFLGDLQFAKVRDPFTAHQDIASFVSGVLPDRSRDTVEISDTDRIRKAGFDTKTSFRKGPTKRARRRASS